MTVDPNFLKSLDDTTPDAAIKGNNQPVVTKFFDYYGTHLLCSVVVGPRGCSFLLQTRASIVRRFLSGQLNMESHPKKSRNRCVKQKDGFNSSSRISVLPSVLVFLFSNHRSSAIQVYSEGGDSQYTNDTFQAWARASSILRK